MWSPPQLLVLDEVTTHVDADTIVALIGVLKQFQAAILCVIHDRFFMCCVLEGESINTKGQEDDGEDESPDSDDEAEQTRERVVYRMIKGNAKELPKSMAQYEQIASQAADKQGR